MEEDFETEEFEDDEEAVDLDEEVLDEEEVDLEVDLDDEDVDPAIAEEEEDVLPLEEEPDSDEVEASLDKIVEERLGVRAGVDDEDDEDFDDPYPSEDRSGGIGISPKKPGEFVCSSCFLVKHPSQLADAARTLCRDCV